MPRPRAHGVSTNPVAENDDSIPLSERADVLRLLLDNHLSRSRNIGECGLRPSVVEVDGLAAIKYEMETALNVIRAFLVSRASITKYNAVQLYGVAWDCDFTKEAKTLSTETLKCNLNALDTQVYLENMSVMSPQS